jgi:hypothetical protein
MIQGAASMYCTLTFPIMGGGGLMSANDLSTAAGSNSDSVQPPRQRLVRTIIIIVYLLIVALLVIVAILALLLHKPWVVIAIGVSVLALLSILLMRRPIMRLVRELKNHKIAVGLIVGLIVVGGSVALTVSAVFSGHRGVQNVTIIVGYVTVPYTASVRINGGEVHVHERITITKAIGNSAYLSYFTETHHLAEPKTPAFIPVLGASQFTSNRKSQARFVLIVPKAWSPGRPINGQQTFQMHRNFPVHTRALGITTVQIKIDSGKMYLYHHGKRYYMGWQPQDGSLFKITAKKGAIAATYPASTSTVDVLRDHLDQTVVKLPEPGNYNVRLVILPSFLQNPSGVKVYQAISWGPLPYLAGLVTLGLLAGVGRRGADLLDKALARVSGGGSQGSPDDDQV